MRLREIALDIPRDRGMNAAELIGYFRDCTHRKLKSNQRPIRFVVNETTETAFCAEVGVIESEGSSEADELGALPDIFYFKKRNFESIDQFNTVLLIPTGIGAEIGGHCGDGNAVARLMAAACDVLITHPNVLNAADINEMTENTLYVEGSFITRLMMGQIGLQRVRSNRVLMLMDQHEDPYFNEAVVNAVSSARITVGMKCSVQTMSQVVSCEARYGVSGRASAEVGNYENLVSAVNEWGGNFDAVALATRIQTPPGTHESYFSSDSSMLNPWGGPEAMMTHGLALMGGKPVAHSPLSATRSIRDFDFGIVDPRKAPESLSVTYLHCILKGLFRHPRMTSADQGLGASSVSCLVVPDGCLGLPTLAALAQGIPVIAVLDNKNLMRNSLQEIFANSVSDRAHLYFARNYIEAAGICSLLRSGVDASVLQRPLAMTEVR